jgi:hypothetical protein
MDNRDDAGWVEDRGWSQRLHAKRHQRERQRANFLDKVLRAPRSARRWFRIEDIEPDARVRSNLINQWRASIWHRDLCLEGKSQVLCLSDFSVISHIQSRLPTPLRRIPLDVRAAMQRGN